MKNLKMEQTQAVKLYLLVLSLLFAYSSAQSQTLIPTNNKGGYIFEKKINKEKATLTKIYGHVYSLKDSSEISAAKITLGCTKITTNKDGKFIFQGIYNDLQTNYLQIVSLGYKTVETDFFQIVTGVNLKIDFYLEEDDKPFIDCITN